MTNSGRPERAFDEAQAEAKRKKRMGKISKIQGRPILDSQGAWTVEVTVHLRNGVVASASVPQGKSRGSFEAAYVHPLEACKNIANVVMPALAGVRAERQEEVDRILRETDGSARKERLGANTMLGVSLACARAIAQEAGIPLWRYLRILYGDADARVPLPKLFINMINGGLHASSTLAFQEYIVIPRSSTVRESLEVGLRFFQCLRDVLEKEFGKGSIGAGDEGGFSAHFESNEQPFSLLKETAEKLGIEESVSFGLDAAASNVRMETEDLFLFYEEMIQSYNLVYIEDAFGEDKFSDFARFLRGFGRGRIIAGDDLTVTHLTRMKEAREQKSVNGVIIKPNQVGTLWETLEAVRHAKEWGWAVIVSHRSGETNDDFVADLACAVGAQGIKIGAPRRGERIAKYNRLLAIESEQ